MTSATERIRALLDERGVEYDTDDEDGCEFTEWVANGLEWEADSRGELVSLMPVMLITPEQAIAVTLGTGVNCSKAEHDAGGCLGFQSGDDDEPVDQCKACHKYTSYEVEL